MAERNNVALLRRMREATRRSTCDLEDYIMGAVRSGVRKA